jgi:hypothetical protein
MEVLKPGRKMPWIGKELTCPACNCEFRLNDNDKPKSEDDLDPIYYFDCPNCTYLVTLVISRKEANPAFGT